MTGANMTADEGTNRDNRSDEVRTGKQTAWKRLIERRMKKTVMPVGTLGLRSLYIHPQPTPRRDGRREAEAPLGGLRPKASPCLRRVREENVK